MSVEWERNMRKGSAVVVWQQVAIHPDSPKF